MGDVPPGRCRWAAMDMSEPRSGGFVAELRRRNVFRIAAAYAVVAWLLLQLADILFGNFGAPAWVFRTFVVVLVLGFPLALLLAWAYELTPEGIRRSGPAGLAQAPMSTRRAAWIVDALLIAVPAVALAHFAWDRLQRAPVEAPVAAEREASIAVLPFADMSAERDHEYFADGLSEEILNLLAGVREIKVTARTSSFAFKGKDTPITEIGHLLGVAHVLEGSVRRSGERLRITAQLIEARSGFHLWSETYDRRMEDIFVIQGEIAAAIAEALHLTLTGQAIGVTEDLDLYDLYLRARSLMHQRQPEAMQQARKLIDQVLARDPEYAPALAASGALWLLQTPGNYGDVDESTAVAEARLVLQKALALDPGLAEAHANMGLLFLALADNAAAQAYLDRALELNPSLTEAQFWRSQNLAALGRLREALAMAEHVVEHDPLFLPARSNLVLAYVLSADFAAADRLVRQLQRSHPDWASTNVVINLINQGRLAEADQAVRQIPAPRNVPAMYTFGGTIRMFLGDFEWVAASSSFVAAPALVLLGRVEEGLFKGRELLAGRPGFNSQWGMVWGLSLAGRHQELLDWTAAEFGDLAGLSSAFPIPVTLSREFGPVAVAQRATGKDEALAATLSAWRDKLAMLEANGFRGPRLAYARSMYLAQAGERDAALAVLAEAIDAGWRDAVLDRWPEFEPLRQDPRFHALVDRMKTLVNRERAVLDLPPLQ
jgi:TolB-like protein/Tfp pilus assembly protein PilF